MQAEFQELETLLEIQKIDLDIMRATKKRVELPQRIAVMRLRKKRGEIQAKLDQVLELQKKSDDDMTVIEDEDRSLVEKQERAQELIDAAGSDFRKVESHSKEMAGAAKRREALAEKRVTVEAQLAKIKGVRDQLEGAIAASEAEEARLRADFEDEDNALAEHIRMSTAQRDKLASTIDPELVKLYEKTAAKTGTGRRATFSHPGFSCRWIPLRCIRARTRSLFLVPISYKHTHDAFYPSTLLRYS